MASENFKARRAAYYDARTDALVREDEELNLDIQEQQDEICQPGRENNRENNRDRPQFIAHLTR